MDLKRAMFMFIQDDELFFIPQNIVLQQPTLPPALIEMDVKCLSQFHDETLIQRIFHSPVKLYHRCLFN